MGRRLIDTLVKSTIKSSNTHRSPALPNPNYISIATSGGGKSSHRQISSNLLPIHLKLNADLTLRNKISGGGLSKTADTASTPETFVPLAPAVIPSELVSENISMAEQPRPDLRFPSSSGICDKKIKYSTNLKGPSLNVTSTVTGSAIRNELYSANKSSLKRSSVAQPYKVQVMSDRT
jgi:hypothetical protein